MAKGKFAAVAVAVGSALGAAAIWRRRSGKGAERVEVYYADGSMVTLPGGLRRGGPPAPRRPPGSLAGAELSSLTDAELARRIREHAYLEGDFVLRSGKRSRYYLDKYRFETRPDLLAALGERLAARIREVAPAAVRIAGPELGAIALAASASLSSGLPFLIVRKEAKELRHRAAARGRVRAGRAGVPRRGRRHVGRGRRRGGRRPAGGRSRVRRGGLRRRSRGGRGGRSGPAGVQLHALFRARDVLERLKRPANPHGCLISIHSVRVFPGSPVSRVDGRRGQWQRRPSSSTWWRTRAD